MQLNFLTWWRVLGAHFRGHPLRVCSRFSWELLQTLAGLTFVSWFLLRYRIGEVRERDGVVALSTPKSTRSWGAVSLGTVVAGDARLSGKMNNPLYMHEFGHVLQSRASGPLYLFKFGLPSIRSATTSGSHYLHPVEQDANLRAKQYFSSQEGYTDWPQEDNTIVRLGELMPIHWWEFLPGIFPFWHLWIAGKSPKRLKKT